MKKLYFLIFPLLLQASSPFNSPKAKKFDLSCFNTKPPHATLKVKKSQKIRCSYICDKRVYTQHKIANAISFYKSSKYYGFKE